MPDDTEAMATPPKAPALPEQLPMSFSLIVCERAYQAQKGVWVPAGTFNELTIHDAEIDFDALGWLIPSLSIFFRIQCDREKTVQVLFCYRLRSINGRRVDLPQTVARADFSLNDQGKLGADGAVKIPAVAIEVGPSPDNERGKDCSLMLQVEAWANGVLAAYQTVELKFQLPRKKDKAEK